MIAISGFRTDSECITFIFNRNFAPGPR